MERYQSKTNFRDIPGICYISSEIPSGYIELPPFPVVAEDKRAFIQIFSTFYHNNDPLSAKGLAQRQDTRFLIQNPPASPLTQNELDAIHDLPYEHNQHPYYERQGTVTALDTIKFSILTHRGCYTESAISARLPSTRDEGYSGEARHPSFQMQNGWPSIPISRAIYKMSAVPPPNCFAASVTEHEDSIKLSRTESEWSVKCFS